MSAVRLDGSGHLRKIDEDVVPGFEGFGFAEGGDYGGVRAAGVAEAEGGGEAGLIGEVREGAGFGVAEGGVDPCEDGGLGVDAHTWTGAKTPPKF